jgi:hypothetical protein
MLAQTRNALAPLALLAALSAPAAHADVITDWNQVASRTFNAAGVGGNTRSRAAAMANAAMFEAVNAVEGRYTPIALKLEPAPKASPVAAAAAAAHRVLLEAAPSQKAKLDEALAETAATVADASARAAGLALGERAGAGIIADRVDDALAAPDTYRPHTSPGVWVPTTPPLFPEYARAKLWGSARNDAYRPGPPPALASAQYARDYNETKSLGARASTVRTPAQTDVVRFWTQPNLGTSVDQIARHFIAEKKLPLAESARFSALLYMAVANTFMADWDAKFTYNFWRPVTAIRNGDQDGNDATERDASWTPLNATPMHPEYPSQAAIIAAVLQTIVERQFGANAGPITIVDTATPTLKREYASIAVLAREMNDVRVWGGVHFRTSLDVATGMGRRIADDLMAGYMKPK